MYVMPVAQVLALDRLPMHEAVRDRLVAWEPGMTTVFVSQTWLSTAHPDNGRNEKLRLLQSFLRSTASGIVVKPTFFVEVVWGNKMRIAPSSIRQIAYVWLDCMCVPQADPVLQASAIGSIPNYVANSSFFVVLAGAWVHEDHDALRDIRAWCGRGWCRVESLCNALSPEAKPVIVMQSPSDIQTYGPVGISGREWTHYPVGTGQFSVEADRLALGPIIATLIEERMEAKRAEGTEDSMRWFRYLHSSKARLLRGTGVVVTPLTPDAWMQSLGFKSPTEKDRCGWGPLTYAVIEDNLQVATFLLDAGADVEGVLKQDHNPLNRIKGEGNLCAALRNDNVQMVKLLLSRGADPMRLDALMSTCCAYACIGGHAPSIETVLEAAPQLVGHQNLLGNTPLSFLPQFGHKEALQHFFARRPDAFAESKTGLPLGWLANACMQLGDVDTIACLLDLGCDVNYFDAKNAHPRLRRVLALARLAFRVTKRPPLAIIEFLVVGFGTALHTAAYRGNLGAVELLLRRSADVSSNKHQLKMTPLHCAAIGGHRAICELLMKAGASADARDSRKRTPAMWALRRGHPEIAQLMSASPSVKNKTPARGPVHV